MAWGIGRRRLLRNSFRYNEISTSHWKGKTFRIPTCTWSCTWQNAKTVSDKMATSGVLLNGSELIFRIDGREDCATGRGVHHRQEPFSVSCTAAHRPGLLKASVGGICRGPRSQSLGTLSIVHVIEFLANFSQPTSHNATSFGRMKKEECEKKEKPKIVLAFEHSLGSIVSIS